MSQFSWAYLSPGGQQYIVGLYHGPESGHVVVYCNNEVVAIDFQVVESARYAFFIEEDLCEVRIEKKGDSFQYFFESNEEIDTPLNQKRKQAASRDRRFLIFIIIAAVTLALLLGGFARFALLKAREQARAELFAGRYGVETEAIITPRTDRKGKVQAVFSYQTHNQKRNGKMAIDPDGILANGMPLEAGDIFIAYYHVLRPEVCKIDFANPTALQQERYRERVRNRHLRYHPGISQAEADSLLDKAFMRFGTETWPIFYWQHARPEENPKYNQQRFAEAMRLLENKSAIE